MQNRWGTGRLLGNSCRKKIEKCLCTSYGRNRCNKTPKLSAIKMRYHNGQFPRNFWQVEQTFSASISSLSRVFKRRNKLFESPEPWPRQPFRICYLAHGNTPGMTGSRGSICPSDLVGQWHKRPSPTITHLLAPVYTEKDGDKKDQNKFIWKLLCTPRGWRKEWINKR